MQQLDRKAAQQQQQAVRERRQCIPAVGRGRTVSGAALCKQRGRQLNMVTAVMAPQKTTGVSSAGRSRLLAAMGL